jgi:clumping factor B (fragment)
MSEVATAELGLALTDATDNNGGGFNVFSSLRGGAGGEDFSSGTDDISSEEVSVGTDETANLDLVAVAGGEAKLDTSIGDGGDSKNAPAPVDALSLAGKSEINSPENRMSNANSQDNSETLTPVNPELCEKFGTIACIGCDFALLCAERQAAMAAKSNEDQPDKQLSTLEKLLQEDKAPGEIVWAQPTPDDDVSREQLLAVNEEQSLIDDSPSIFKSESEPEPKPRPKSEPEPEPEGQTLSDTQPSPRLSNKQKESAAVALSQAAESRSSKSLNHEVDRRHSNDEEKSTTAHIANVVKKTTISDDGGANLEANSNSAAKASKEPLAQIYSDNTNEYTRQDELPRVVDRTADDSGKLVNQQTATVNRVAQTTQRSNKHVDQEVSSAVNTTEQISSVNTHQAIQIPEPEDTGSTVATTRSQKEPAIEKVSSTPIDANDTLADSGTSTAIDREYSTQEPPALKLKSISTKNNLLKKTTPKNITTRPNSDSSTDFEVSAEMSLEAKKNPSIDKQNPLADDKKDNISSPSAVESVDYSKKTLPETRLVNAVQNTSDGEYLAVKLAEKESAPSKKAVVKNHNIHYSDSASAFNQTKQVETVANTPAVKLPAETASWASENEIFVVDREETFANNHRKKFMQREVVPIDGGNDLPTLPQNELTPKVDIEQDLELKNTTEINLQLRSDRSSERWPKLDEMVNSVLPPSGSLKSELLSKLDETSSGLQEHDERQISELWPKPDEASNRLIDQADFEDDKPVRQKAQQTRMTQPNENDTIYVDLRNERASSEVDSLHGEPTADYTNQIEMNNDNDLNCQLNDNSGSQAEKLYEVAFAHPLAALWTDDSRLNPENNKISKGSSTSVTSWLTKLVGAVAVYVACSRRESTLGISN